MNIAMYADNKGNPGMYLSASMAFLVISVVWISTAPQRSRKLTPIELITYGVVVEQWDQLIYIYNVAEGLENEGLAMAVDYEPTFCFLVF